MGARKLDKFEGLSSDQAEKLIQGAENDNGFDTRDAKAINDERNNVLSLIDDATEFNKDEKLAFKSRLHSLNATKLENITNFSHEIEKKRSEVNKMIGEYTRQVMQSRDVFGKDETRGLDAAQQYIEEFKQQDEATKREWMGKLNTEINERIELFEAAKKLMPSRMDYVKTLRRSELRELLAEKVERSKGHAKEFESFMTQNNKLFSPKEQEQYKSELEDSTPNEQRTLLKKLKAELKERNQLAKLCDKIGSKYQSKLGDFSKKSLEERREAIESLEIEIEQEYGKIQNTHPLNKHIAEDDKKAALDFFREVPLDKKIEYMEILGKQFEHQEKTVSKPFLQALDKLVDKKMLKRSDAQALEREFFDAPTERRRKELAAKLNILQESLEDDAKTAEKLTQKFDTLLEKAVTKGYIRKPTEKKARANWEKASLQEKRSILFNIENDRVYQERVKLVERFNKLPDKAKKAHPNFFEQSYSERAKTVLKIEKSLGIEEEKPQDIVEETLQETESENDVTETTETTQSKEQQIQQLFAEAITAERKKEWSTAIDKYEQIIDADPSDEIAKRNLQFAQEELAKTKDKREEAANNAEVSPEEEKAIIQHLASVAEMNDIRKSRMRNTVTSLLVKEAAEAETRNHGSVKSMNRTEHLSDEEKKMQEDLPENFNINEEGKVEKGVWLHVKGMRLEEKKEAKIIDFVSRNIIHSDSQHAKTNIHFYDDSDNVLSALAAQKELAKRDDELRARITGCIAGKMKMQAANDNNQPADLNAKIRKVVNSRNLDLNLSEIAA